MKGPWHGLASVMQDHQKASRDQFVTWHFYTLLQLKMLWILQATYDLLLAEFIFACFNVRFSIGEGVKG